MNLSFNAVTISCLQHVTESTEMTFTDREKALFQAELFTDYGFEVTTPKSYDGGETFTITVTR